MGDTWTLESLIEEANAKFGSCSVSFGNEKTELRNPIRIPEKARERVFEILDEIQADADATKADDSHKSTLDQAAVFAEFLTLVGDAKTPKLLAKIGDDLAVVMALFDKYQKDVGLGEASASSE